MTYKDIPRIHPKPEGMGKILTSRFRVGSSRGAGSTITVVFKSGKQPGSVGGVLGGREGGGKMVEGKLRLAKAEAETFNVEICKTHRADHAAVRLPKLVSRVRVFKN